MSCLFLFVWLNNYLSKLFGLPHKFSYNGHGNVCTRGKLLPPSTINTGVNCDFVFSCLFIVALWLPVGKRLTIWLSCM